MFSILLAIFLNVLFQLTVPTEGYFHRLLEKFKHSSEAGGPWLKEGKVIKDEIPSLDESGYFAYQRVIKQFTVGKMIKEGKVSQLYQIVEDRGHLRRKSMVIKTDIVVKVYPLELDKHVRDYLSNDSSVRLILGEKWGNFFVQEFDSFTDRKFEYKILESCPYGTLINHIGNNDTNLFPDYIEDEFRRYLFNVVMGLVILKKNQIVHGNINLDSIYLCENMQPKLSDFGYSERVASNSVPNHYKGPAAFMAPEAYNKGEYDYAADVWAFGVVLFKLLTKGGIPFEGSDYDTVYASITKGGDGQWFDQLGNVSEEAKDLLIRIFVADPTSRISIDEIRFHPWFKSGVF